MKSKTLNSSIPVGNGYEASKQSLPMDLANAVAELASAKDLLLLAKVSKDDYSRSTDNLSKALKITNNQGLSLLSRYTNNRRNGSLWRQSFHGRGPSGFGPDGTMSLPAVRRMIGELTKAC